MMERARLKAMAKVATLTFDVMECKNDLKWDNGNGIISRDQLECCLRSTERELDIWNYILKITTNEEN